MSQQFNVSPDNFRMPWIISQALKGVAKRAARLKNPRHRINEYFYRDE
jgi:hypothetical protein